MMIFENGIHLITMARGNQWYAPSTFALTNPIFASVEFHIDHKTVNFVEMNLAIFSFCGYY